MFLNKIKSLINPVLQQSVRHARVPVEEVAGPPPSKIEKTVNSINVLGRVGADPQLRGSTEHPVVTFSIATHANYKYDNGDWAQRTDWHRVAVFKPNLRDTVMDFLKKGQRAMVQGRLTYGEITDHNGNPKPSATIVADDVIFFREK